MQQIFFFLIFLMMTRQSITLTKPNDEWLKARIESEEYTSKSEIVNDLIRRAREKEQEKNEWIRPNSSKQRKADSRI